MVTEKEVKIMIDIVWINAAILTIQQGIADKLTKGNITIYRVKNIIRIDIKTEE